MEYYKLVKDAPKRATAKLRDLHATKHSDRFAIIAAFQRAAMISLSRTSTITRWVSCDLHSVLLDILVDPESYPTKYMPRPDELAVL